jgi:serine protease Do
MTIRLAIGNALLGSALAAVAAAAQTAPPPPPPPPAATPTPRAAPRARVVTGTVASGSTYLGIGVKEVDGERAKALKLKDARGAEVTSVTEDSPASKAGLKEGDVILEWNGQPVEGGAQLARFVRETPAGRQVKIGVWSNGSMKTVTTTMEATKSFAMGGDNTFVIPDIRIPEMNIPMPNIEIPRFQMLYQSPMLGIYGEALGQQEQLAEYFGVKEGVLVKSVNKGSAAEKAGIKAGDVIVKVEDSSVGGTGDITTALRAARTKKTVTVTLIRNRKEMPVTVTIENAATSAVRAGLVIEPGVLRISGSPKVLRIQPKTIKVPPVVLQFPANNRII